MPLPPHLKGPAYSIFSRRPDTGSTEQVILLGCTVSLLACDAGGRPLGPGKHWRLDDAQRAARLAKALIREGAALGFERYRAASPGRA